MGAAISCGPSCSTPAGRRARRRRGSRTAISSAFPSTSTANVEVPSAWSAGGPPPAGRASTVKERPAIRIENFAPAISAGSISSRRPSIENVTLGLPSRRAGNSISTWWSERDPPHRTSISSFIASSRARRGAGHRGPPSSMLWPRPERALKRFGVERRGQRRAWPPPSLLRSPALQTPGARRACGQ